MNEEIERHIKISIEYRGTIIHKSIIMERELEKYIIKSFVDDTIIGFRMIELIFDRMTFDSKLSIMEQLIKEKFGSDFEKKATKFFRSFRELIKVRNMMAHYELRIDYEHTGDSVPKEIQLVNYRNNFDMKTFSKGDYKLFNERYDKCYEVIRRWYFELQEESGWLS